MFRDRSPVRQPRRQGSTYSIRRIFWPHASTVEEKTHGGHLFALTLAERVHELFEWRRSLDLEKDLVVVIGDLNIQVFRRGRRFARGGIVGHLECLAMEKRLFW